MRSLIPNLGLPIVLTAAPARYSCVRVLRSFAAVVAGLAVCFVLVMVGIAAAMAAFGLKMGDVPSGGYLVTNLSVSFVAAILGGFVCARLARAREFVHAAVAAAVLVALSFVSRADAGTHQPRWYLLVVTMLSVCGIFLGTLAQLSIKRFNRST